MCEENREVPTPELERRKAEREAEGKPVRRINQELNTRKSSSDIRSEITQREAMGKPAGDLRRELGSRG
ncbi:MAG: hypothetical protein A2V72_00755 [Candidatus Nealsonbacteria bacterium RBG_13_37_56]|uniref:Uncharacterized protein n=1 Tax=Candidatus Nealsonbacteria bacterium RBG_13_37_56 TaxID=1801661 RepID=A0A1G2DWC4_9BACT|nr:MAG: hypothetical protein A2V72_00755 [Candidatus Nealsonbacteria bacterium RBG_13_37_56]